jgi:hypothetical protein
MQQRAAWPPISRHLAAIKTNQKNLPPLQVDSDPEFEQQGGKAGRIFGVWATSVYETVPRTTT